LLKKPKKIKNLEPKELYKKKFLMKVSSTSSKTTKIMEKNPKKMMKKNN